MNQLSNLALRNLSCFDLWFRIASRDRSAKGDFAGHAIPNAIAMGGELESLVYDGRYI
jgi:hypothetical protein